MTAKQGKIVGIAIAAVLALPLATFALIAATFNPNQYKPQLIRLVQQETQRTLSIPGEIKLTFFPRIGADLGKVALSEKNSQAQFASVERAHLSVALLPLLTKRIVVDRIKAEGLRATIRRNRDGSTSIDDLLEKEAAKKGSEDNRANASAAKTSIGGIDLVNAHIVLDDRQQNRTIELAHLMLEAGSLASAAPGTFKLTAHLKADKPLIDARLAARSNFLIDAQQKRYRLSDSKLDLQGKLFDWTNAALQFTGAIDLQPAAKQWTFKDVKLTAGVKQAAQTIDVGFDLPKLAISENQVSGGKLQVHATSTSGARKFHAQLAAPAFEGTAKAFKVPAITVNGALQDGKLDAHLNLAGTLHGNLDQPSLAMDLRGKLENGAIDAKLGMTGFSAPAFTFNIHIDQIDVDRYRAPTAQAAGPDQASGETNRQGSGGTSTGKPLDLSMLRKLRADGKLRIGTLTFHRLKLSNLRAELHAGAGKINVNPLAADLYGGQANGSLSTTASKAPRIGLQQTLTGIDVGSLLKDAIGKQAIDGQGNVSLDVDTAGGSVAHIRQSLQGNARLELRDGAVYGVNVAQSIRTAKARIGQLRGNAPPQSGTASVAEKTDFSEMSGSFAIRDGVAHNDDLRIKSPLLRVGGSGEIDLANEQLNYLMRATVVQTLQGQGGPEQQSLKGATIPVRLSGPFHAIRWQIDVQTLLGDIARQKLEENKEVLRDKAREKLKEGLKGLFGK